MGVGTLPVQPRSCGTSGSGRASGGRSGGGRAASSQEADALQPRLGAEAAVFGAGRDGGGGFIRIRAEHACIK